jgi:transglutaminase-like putative cysteine protease
VAIAAYLGVLFGITDVVGGGTRLAVAVGLAVVAATAFARAVSPRTAMFTAAALLVAGLAGYYVSIPPGVRGRITVISAAVDSLRLLTGVSILRLVNAETWVLVTAPVPTFLAWYLACRARYVGAALAAGGMLGFLVLTGNAGLGAALFGVAGVALAVGLATLSVPSGIRTQWETLALLVAVMVVLPATVTVLPFDGVQPAYGGSAPGLESTLTGSSSALEIAGSVTLSPKVRFRVESSRRSKWQTTAYDRYTGSGWVATGETDPLSGDVEGPPGETDAVEQRIRAVSRLESYPSAWKPVSVQGATAGSAEVKPEGGLAPADPLEEGDTVRIESQVLNATPGQLRATDTDYPDRVVDRYTQLPGSTPDRVGNLTSRITAGVDNPYDAAETIRRYLSAVKNYSLTVDKPEGDVADAFLFEMRAGYCTYFATTMVTMLRSQGIPARFVTGYMPGEALGDGERIVRGQDAHAWVQVYFPDHGWVDFDPTPAPEREAARERNLGQARGNGTSGNGVGVITVTRNYETATETPTQSGETFEGGSSERIQAVREQAGFPEATPVPGGTPTPDPNTSGDATPTVTFDDPVDANGGGNGNGDGNAGVTIPPRDRKAAGYVLLALIGLVALAHGTGTTRSASRAVGMHVQRRRDPATDIERAFARLQALLERQYRERRPRETPRAYLAAIDADDDRIDRVVGIYERARYGNEATRSTADEAVEAVDGLVADASPIEETPLRWASAVLRRVR